jgi:hypothetical protein
MGARVSTNLSILSDQNQPNWQQYYERIRLNSGCCFRPIILIKKTQRIGLTIYVNRMGRNKFFCDYFIHTKMCGKPAKFVTNSMDLTSKNGLFNRC